MSWRRRAVVVVAGLAVLAPPVLPVADAGSTAPLPPSEPTMGPLISGTVSELDGTHVWTDYAYDDRGANAGADPTYPAEAAPGNAADLIQLQLRPRRGALRIQAVLETLTDPAVPLIGLGLDLDADPATGAPGVPGGQWGVAGTPLGLERVVVMSGSTARVLAFDGTDWVEDGTVEAATDVERNTVTTTVPRDLLGRSGPRWRAIGIAGLAVPGESWVDGSGPIYDLAYVHDTSSANWQSTAQASVLTGGTDASVATATIDVARLPGRRALAQPEPGVKNTFLYRSALRLGEGMSAVANRQYAGPYQPYVVWFPDGLPDRPPLVVFLHGAMSNHLSGSYGDDAALAELGPLQVGPGVIAPDAVVITPLGRGASHLAYDGPAEQDVLDAIADVSHRFDVDEDRVVLTGYSLGGVGTFRLAQLHPDRWAGAVEMVGAHDLGALTVLDEAQGIQTLPNQLENLRNLPFRMAHSRADELEILIGAVQPELAALELQELGYDFRYWQFYGRDHLTFPVATIQCELEAAIARGRVHDPARVVFSQEPAIQSEDSDSGLHVPHDRAYWMSEMVVRGSSFAPGDEGNVDVTSLARADRQPAVAPVLGASENITAGRDVCGDNPDVRTNDVWSVMGQAWSPGPPQTVSNGFAATLTRVASVTLDLPRMGLDVAEPLALDVTTDGDTRLRLAAPWSGAVVVEPEGGDPEVRCAVDGVLDVDVTAATSTVSIYSSSSPGCSSTIHS